MGMVREAAEPYRLLTPEEYLATEPTSDIRHEYVGGYVYAMAGATRRHNRIARNITRLLEDAARGTGCQVYMSDVHLRANEDVYYYPDIIVSCDPGDNDERVVTRPCLIVEILSPSTELTDRREKLLIYRRIQSLRGYVIVSQNERGLEVHSRTDDSAPWSVRFIADGVFTVPCPPTQIAVDDVYLEEL
jgi:Uma2 family endonuclease